MGHGLMIKEVGTLEFIRAFALFRVEFKLSRHTNEVLKGGRSERPTDMRGWLMAIN